MPIRVTLGLVACIATVLSVPAKDFAEGNECKVVKTVPNLNLTEYTRATWFIQEMQITGYEPLNQDYCVTATYNQEHKKVPFFKGTVVTVYNYANEGGVNGKAMGAVNTTSKPFELCARVPHEEESSKLLVAPCLIPNLFAGPYWVLAVGGSQSKYEWAVVSGGQPTVQYDDGCTTKEDGVNGSGLWLFSRKQVASKETIDAMHAAIKAQGITLSRLHKVPQAGCTYHDEALFKPDPDYQA